MGTSTELRWINDPPADGVTNMARDEALLQRVGRNQSPPTLRFYRWNPPTISLGYFQTYAEYAALPPPARDLAVVRRQTGGGAILHDLELTYSLVLPMHHALLNGGNPNSLYYHVHTVFADLLASLNIQSTRGPVTAGACTHRGPFFCFERHSCFDLIVAGQKIMGSAQRRTPHAVLQHGSFILDTRFPQQKCTTLAAHDPNRDSDPNRDRKGAVITVESLYQDTALSALAHAIAADNIGRASMFEQEEETLAEELKQKYADSAWTQRR